MTVRRTARVGLVVLAALGPSSCADQSMPPVELAQDIVDRATDTLGRFEADKDALNFAEHVSKSRGVVVMPRVIKAGFIYGVEAGEAVLVARTADGGWGYPAFYNLAGTSYGLQIGVQDAETVLVIRTDKALDAILRHQAKFGVDFGITIGLFGAGVESGMTTALDADVLGFTNPILGLYGGVSMEGAALVRRRDLNEAYYGAGATPRDIVHGAKYANPKAEPLREALARF